MKKTDTHPSPYFDPLAVRKELTAIYNENGDAADARPAVLDRLKDLVHNSREQARLQLIADRNGPRCAKGLAHFQDELVRLLYDYTITHVYRATNPADAERMAVIATGGYGREMLAPGSDIDLLFLLPYKQTPWGESVAEYMLYFLWDLGFKVGHATRTIDQCLRLSLSDTTIRTSLLDMWLITGDRDLCDDLEVRFRKDVVTGTEREFVDAKLAERAERHDRTGESRYKVEPNIKDGKGGLRDLHTLNWLSKYLIGAEVGPESIERGFFTREEATTFRRCEGFLWTVRCFLHFTTGRPEERLTFEVQSLIAEQLGYKDKGGLRAVERFMKHYFLVAKDVGDLTAALCTALELQQVKTAPSLGNLLNPMNWGIASKSANNGEFHVDNGRLNISDPDVFKKDPVNLIRFFAEAEVANVSLHPAAMRQIRRSYRLIDDDLRNNKEANRIFLQLLTGKTNPEATLRRMNETGVLGRFVPQFGRVVAMMQFNMYHHYTVDEHLIRTVGGLTAIESGEMSAELPLSTELVKTINTRKILYVAAFLHDIGKGQEEDHSIVGANIAKELCPRFGFTASETETVVWLIQEHLTMSNIAQSRDITDPTTIRLFADVVQIPERLKLLLLLTVADIRAVGPGVWNGWKGQLLRSLYYETEPLVSGGHTHTPRAQIVSQAQHALRDALSDWPAKDLDEYVARHYPDYWMRTDLKRHIYHARLLRRAELEGKRFALDHTTDAFTAITELTVLAANHPRLLALFAGACAASGANIMSAHITTTRDGFALDTFLLARQFSEDEDESRRVRRIDEFIQSLLKGETKPEKLLARRKNASTKRDAFTVPPEVYLSNTLSEDYTVVEVSGLDRSGLLYDLTSDLADLSLDIASAHITTFGEKAVDVFYVTDLTGKKIESETRKKKIIKQLTATLSTNPRA